MAENAPDPNGMKISRVGVARHFHGIVSIIEDRRPAVRRRNVRVPRMSRLGIGVQCPPYYAVYSKVVSSHGGMVSVARGYCRNPRQDGRNPPTRLGWSAYYATIAEIKTTRMNGSVGRMGFNPCGFYRTNVGQVDIRKLPSYDLSYA